MVFNHDLRPRIRRSSQEDGQHQRCWLGANAGSEAHQSEPESGCPEWPVCRRSGRVQQLLTAFQSGGAGRPNLVALGC